MVEAGWEKRRCRLYTPRCLIRKLKIYLTAGSKRNYKAGAVKKVTTRQRRDISSGNDNRLRVQIFVVVFALWRELHVLVSKLWVLEDFAFVIADDDFFVVVIKDVTGIDRHLSPAAGSVDDKLRHSITGGVTAQAFDDLDALRD